MPPIVHLLIHNPAAVLISP